MNEEYKIEEPPSDGGVATAMLKEDAESRSPKIELLREMPVAIAPAAAVNGGAIAGPAAPAAGGESAAPLLSPDEAKDFRLRWDAIQVGFVDEPRLAVEQADALVAAAMQRLTETFASERTKLEGEWDRQERVSTESLRLALRRYRSFFGRLLSI